MECERSIEAHRLYRKACYHDKRRPNEPSQVRCLPEWVIEGQRQFKRDERARQRENASPLITIKVQCDGIVDCEAVERAVQGLRVELTAIEMSLAIMKMHVLEIPRAEIARRMGMTIEEGSKYCPFHGGWGNIEANWDRATEARTRNRELVNQSREIKARIRRDRAERQKGK